MFLLADELHIWSLYHKNKGDVGYCVPFDFERFWWGKKKQIYWSEYCRLKAADFSVAQWGIVEGCKVTGSQLNPSPVFISLTYSCVIQEEEKQISGFSSILVLDFHQRMPAAGIQGPCLYLFIFIYWNELHFASIKGNSLNTTSVCIHLQLSSNTAEKRLLSCLKTEHINIVMKGMAESAMYCINMWAIDMHSTI